MKPKIIAFYLPQYHPTPENDEWWGKGFTEWTNVGRAKSLFKGHDQPRVPTELGYYDLRLPVVREQQAELARKAGVTAFCYWHYWFGNGKQMLSEIFDEVLSSGQPDFPFCLGWANHSWFAKSWDKTTPNKLLVKQEYPGIEDQIQHFQYLLRAFKDPRYIKVDNKPFLLIFDPFTLPDIYIENFRKFAKEAGFPDLYIVANSYKTELSPNYFTEKGYDAVSYARLSSLWAEKIRRMGKLERNFFSMYRVFKQLVTRRPRGARDYSKDFPKLITKQDKDRRIIPQIVPQWDHSPRSEHAADLIYYNSTPESFYLHCLDAFEVLKDKPEDEQILILKSWNEWGEGNYMEPDISNGDGYIKALRKALNKVSK